MACPCAVQHGHHASSPPSLCCAGFWFQEPGCPTTCTCDLCGNQDNDNPSNASRADFDDWPADNLGAKHA